MPRRRRRARRCGRIVDLRRDRRAQQREHRATAAAAPTAPTTSRSARAGSPTSGAASAATSSRQAPARRPREADLANARLSVQASLAQNYLLLRVQDAQIALLQRHGHRVRALAAADTQTSTPRASSRAATSRRPRRSSSRRRRRCTTRSSRARSSSTRSRCSSASRRPSCRSRVRAQARRRLSRHPARGAVDAARAPPGHRRGRAPRRERQRADRRRAGGVLPERSRSPPAAALQSSVIGSLLSLPSRYWSLGAALAQTIFDAGLRTRAEGAGDRELRRDGRDLSLDGAHRLPGGRGQPGGAARCSRRRPRCSRKRWPRHASRRRSRINQYRAGTASYIAVVVLQANALNSERTALGITARRLTASVNLVKALGGGWDATQLASVQ